MTRWNLDEPLSDEYVGEPPTPLASLVYLRGALCRRWRTLVLCALAGLAVAGLYTWHFPVKSEATVTLVLQHPSGSDPTTAMQTDLAILQTRTVAGRALAATSDQGMTARSFLDSYAGRAITDSVLTITAKASTPALATRNVRAIASTYLTYRANQLEASTKAQLSGSQSQLDALRQQLTTAKAQYQQFAHAASGGDIATAAIQRANGLQAQIGALETTVQSAQDATQALIDGSTVLDPASAVPVSPLKHRVLALASGLLGGTALGALIIVLGALTGTRLRRREDVAAATGAPVIRSTPRLPRRTSARTHWLRREGTTAGLQLLADGLQTVATGSGTRRVALVTCDNEAGGLLLASLAGARLTGTHRNVFLTDLSRSGRLGESVRSTVGVALGPAVTPTVHRPAGSPTLTRGPLAGDRGAGFGPNDPDGSRWEAADVAIAVAPADLDAGLDHLAGWAESAVLLVTAGRSTAEQLGTVAGLLRSAGLDVQAVLMVGTSRTDQSFGRDLDGRHRATDGTDAGSTAAGMTTSMTTGNVAAESSRVAR